MKAGPYLLALLIGLMVAAFTGFAAYYGIRAGIREESEKQRTEIKRLMSGVEDGKTSETHDRAKIAAAKADIATLCSGLSQFRIDCDRFPSSDEGLAALTTKPIDAKGWKGPYIEKLPEDPWGHDYAYTTPGNAGQDSYIVESYGSDGAPGGAGDAADISNND